MSRKIQSSVAPKERINIVYRPATGNAKSQTELPLKAMILADLTKSEDSRPIEERQPIDINNDNIDEVLASLNVSTQFSVPNRISGKEGEEFSINLNFKEMSDFSPDSIVQAVEELKQVIALRDALKALRGPLGNAPQMRRDIQELVANADSRKKLSSELGIGKAK
ncbi:MAG: type VI secretion system contractile sheath small subunit [Gammaproteobacteria bacterium]|nr:type VI secretion system contractile sheath small subunit [Gammaproteobacteria bacterium]